MGALRVAIDATPLLGPRTGVGAFVHGLLSALVTDPDDLVLTAFGLTWNGRSALPHALPPGVSPPRRLPAPAAVLLPVWARADHPVVERWTGPIDVVHGTNFVAPPAHRAAAVVTVHDLTAIHYPELCAPASRRYPALVRRALKRGALVHTHTEFVAAEVVDVFGADPDRVTAVPPGVDAPATEPPNPASSAPNILAVGSVEPRKDLPTLVRAFDLVAAGQPDVRLILAGPDAWGVPDLDAALSASRFRSRIERIGWVSDSRRASLLRSATVLAFPSLYEGFGLPPLEAMAGGVPVVATAAGSVPEVVGRAARLVPPRDPEALATALLSVLTNDDERASLVERGRVQVAAYTWERCAHGLLELYRKAARS
jgi:glycosyltransferase involved in cell wall biosynthesis